TGRIDISSNDNADVKYGVNNVLPLVESRRGFSLDLWELDNAARGAEDIDLTDMEKAARDIASFEEKAIYFGLKKAGIAGLKNQIKKNRINFPDNSADWIIE